jgi:electron transport complex protein RnfG
MHFETRLLLLIARLTLAPRLLPADPISREEALKAAFPGAKVVSSMIFLNNSEMEQVAKNSDSKLSTALIARYDATLDGKEVGRAYLDTHIVRTKKESLLIILNPDGKLRRVEIVAFLEPPEYIPPDRWYQQFEGKSKRDKIRLKQDIPAVTGATLTSRATTEAIRRVLAIDALLQERNKKDKTHP